MTLRVIDPAPLLARYPGPACDAGDRPELRWINISQLRVDPTYQREIGRRGESNVIEIARSFRWAKFSVLNVAPIGADLYAIIDGQHHALGAALRGFDSVPCAVCIADKVEQANAFVAINGSVTAMTPLQLHAARLAAGNPEAEELTAACREADVTICRYPVPANNMKPGETLAVSMLQGLLKKYGRDVLVAALSCITKTRKGNPGMIRAQIVEALCAVLEAEPDLRRDRASLVFRMQTFDFVAQFNAARSVSIESGEKVATVLVEAILAHLEGHAAKGPAATPARVPAKSAAAPPPAPKVAAPAKHPIVLSRKGGLSIGRDEISFNGRRLRVVPRAALLVAALAKAMPNCIGDEFLIARIWSARPADAVGMLGTLVRDLSALKAIGLEVRTQKGIGRQLVEFGA